MTKKFEWCYKKLTLRQIARDLVWHYGSNASYVVGDEEDDPYGRFKDMSEKEREFLAKEVLRQIDRSYWFLRIDSLFGPDNTNEKEGS